MVSLSTIGSECNPGLLGPNTIINMAANHPLCNIFAQVINAALEVSRGKDSLVAIDDLTRHHVDDFVSEETFDSIRTILIDIECQMSHQAEEVRMVNNHSVIGTTPDGHRVITPTSAEAFDRLIEMGFRSHTEGIIYDANQCIPTIITNHCVVVKTVIPGPNSIEC